MKDLLLVVLAFAILSIVGIAWEISQESRFNDWLARCNRDGGQVSLTSKGFLSSHYECFKSGQIIDHVEP